VGQWFLLNKTGTQAFLVVKDDNSYAVLAFRGTEKNWRDIQTDILARRIKTPKGKIHVGFKNAFASIEPDIKKSLERLEGIRYISRVIRWEARLPPLRHKYSNGIRASPIR
jgi:hypothetical protein